MFFPKYSDSWVNILALKSINAMRKVRSYPDYLQSKKIDVKLTNLKSVCLALGPTRNLTSLTASIIHLHPSCQVLNHAATRVLPINDTNFLVNYSQSKFNNFVRYAIFISQKGRRGGYGGSITLSHAFDHEVLKKAYQNRYGDSLIKNEIQCIFWKDSMRLSNYIRNNNINLTDIFSKNRLLKFLMPIRNPLDCAISMSKTGHAKKHFRELRDYSLESIVDRILLEISWFLNLKKKNPERYFYFIENQFNEDLLIRLAEYLQIEPHSDWIRDSLNSYQLKKPYNYSPGLIKHYNESIKTYLHNYPSVVDKLSKFSKNAVKVQFT
jgi:hypothetical protein